MRWSEIDQQVCSVARALAVIGDRWSLLIIRDIFLGTRRFEDFCQQLGISRPALASRLRKLEDQGVIAKQRYQARPQRFEYHLTEKGIDLYPILMTLANWGNRWQDDGDGAPVEYMHRDCGHKTSPVLCCDECNKPLQPRSVIPILGPGIIKKIDESKESVALNKLPPFLRGDTLREKSARQ